MIQEELLIKEHTHSDQEVTYCFQGPVESQYYTQNIVTYNPCKHDTGQTELHVGLSDFV